MELFGVTGMRCVVLTTAQVTISDKGGNDAATARTRVEESRRGRPNIRNIRNIRRIRLS
jgi:hypothetical protein